MSMAKIENQFLDIGYMDTLAAGDSFLHRLDPRAKLITTLIFMVAVLSFDKYALSALVPFFIFPAAQISMGELPAGYLLRRVLLVSPFAILIGIFNPLLDRGILIHMGAIQVSGGWVSFFSIVTRSLLTVTAALILIATTGFIAVCTALARLGVPRPFVAQLMFLYRYLFVLTHEAVRMRRAISLRSLPARGLGFKTFIPLIGHLLLRTLDRAQRIHLAMFCRAFDGEIHLMRPLKVGPRGWMYMIGWLLLFTAMRLVNVSRLLGGGIMEMVR